MNTRSSPELTILDLANTIADGISGWSKSG